MTTPQPNTRLPKPQAGTGRARKADGGTDGFVRLPNWIIDDSEMGLHELAVYIVLLRFRDPSTGKCFPGIATIADRARLSTRSVRRAIADLEGRGVIEVDRRSTITDNRPNIYHVAVASEAPEHIWESTARGKRIPDRRAPRASESPGAEVLDTPRDSESLPRDSESLAGDSESPHPGTPSHPKKIHRRRSNKEIQEQALRSALPSRPEEFSFDDVVGVTEKQLDYLHDLHIHLTSMIPNARSRAKWEALTLAEAQQLIGTYLRQIPRNDEYAGPQHGDKAYDALTPTGQLWADHNFIPSMLEAS